MSEQALNKKLFIKDLGLINYRVSWDYQLEIFDRTVATKIENRSGVNITPTQNYLLFCEHPAVYTIGKSGDKNNILVNKEFLEDRKIELLETSRGGDITFHGPGQVVCYPILDLDNFFTDIHKYMRYLEEAVIRTCAEFGLNAGRVQGFTGVWIDFDNIEKARKICAMGVKTSRWVTMHGLALNVNTDLSYFNYIVPCGIKDKEVTSLSKELDKEVDSKIVTQKLTKHLCDLFEFELQVGWPELI
ncbi:MAG TPA: lipoyl(octanoyl) transferase LipB [Cytophagaceae bacterium]|jgi:lipoyl(octanoyl) transferase